MKKQGLFIIFLFVLFSLISGKTWGQQGGFTVGSVHYVINDDGETVIVGGKTTYSSGWGWFAQNTTVTDCPGTSLVIPETVEYNNKTYQVTTISQTSYTKSFLWISTLTYNSTAFQGCTDLESVVIPSTITSIGENTFKNCKNLKTITLGGTTPPTLDPNAFSGINTKNLVIKVPCESVNEYKNASGWSKYKDNIQSTETKNLGVINICEGGKYTFKGKDYTVAGNYIETFDAEDGGDCDVTYAFSLVVKPWVENDSIAIICKGETFEFGGDQLDKAGTYIDTTYTDSTCVKTTLNLKVVEPKNATITLNYCLDNPATERNYTYTDQAGNQHKEDFSGLTESKEITKTYTFTGADGNALSCKETVTYKVNLIKDLDKTATPIELNFCKTATDKTYTYTDQAGIEHTENFGDLTESQEVPKTYTFKGVDGNDLSCKETVKYNVRLIKSKDTTINLSYCRNENNIYTYQYTDQLGKTRTTMFDDIPTSVQQATRQTYYLPVDSLDDCAETVTYNITIVDNTKETTVNLDYCKSNSVHSYEYTDQLNNKHTKTFGEDSLSSAVKTVVEYYKPVDSLDCTEKVTYKVRLIDNTKETTVNLDYCKSNSEHSYEYTDQLGKTHTKTFGEDSLSSAVKTVVE